MRTFEEAWADKEKAGYQYGEDALEHVKFGWEIALAEWTSDVAKERPERLKALFGLVRASVELAFARHDLVTPEANDEDESVDEREIGLIVDDVWGAIQGHGTCAEEPVPEWADALQAIK